MTLEQIAAELYRLPPEDFTARRTARAKDLRGDDRDLADAVAALPKPAVAARALDVLAHERRADLDALLDLADDLRAAQQEGQREEVRSLTTQAHEQVRRVLDAVRQLAAGEGHPLSDPQTGQVEQTLRAAMADPDAAAALRAGLLAKPLAPAGFGPVDLTGAVAVVPEGRPARERRASPQAQDDKARQAKERAEAELEHAERATQQAEQELSVATAQHERAQGDVEERRRQLAEAEERAAAAQERLTVATAARDDAARALADARRRAAGP